MKKKFVKHKHTWRNIIIGTVLVVIFALGLLLWTQESDMTGAVTGITVTNPQKSSNGMTMTFDVEISAENTKKLASGSDVLTIAAGLTDAADKANGLANDGLKSLLGLPSIPDSFGILAKIAGWLDENADKCLRQIGQKYNGKAFKGKFTYSVAKGKGSVLYPTWDYFYATETFTASGFSCSQNLGCVFSAEKTTGGYTGKTGSCFG
jgi:hypothetical protein